MNKCDSCRIKLNYLRDRTKEEDQYMRMKENILIK